MQRLTTLGNTAFMLDHQYRMHPFLSQFSSKTFYNGLLKDGINNNERDLKKICTFQFPFKNKPTLFFSCKGKEGLKIIILNFLKINKLLSILFT
jgi:regulator of nonsense transcripts 1